MRPQHQQRLFNEVSVNIKSNIEGRLKRENIQEWKTKLSVGTNTFSVGWSLHDCLDRIISNSDNDDMVMSELHEINTLSP